MNRKEFSYKLSDGKEYTFSERNKNDVDFYAIQERYRKNRFKFIQENVSDPDTKLSLLMFETHKKYELGRTESGKYVPGELDYFMIFDSDEQKQSLYDSFKVKNPGMSFDEFIKILPSGEIRLILNLLLENEKTEEQPVKKKETESA